MLKMLKKYRNDPKRMVLTFSCQKKMTLNRLGDLNDKNEIQRELDLRAEEDLGKEIDRRVENVACGCNAEQNNGCDCVGEENGYLTEGDERFSNCDKLKSKRALVEREQAQILEKDECCCAFKQNYHIKPLESRSGNCKENDSPLKPQREMRGGIVMEKSFKVLLCDLLTAFGVTITIICALSKIKGVFRAK